MKKIILQHWNGPMREMEKISVQSMKDYASYLGVEYRLLEGHPFKRGLSSQLQKLAMFNEEFDEYDTTLMVDTDMVCVKDLKDDVFELPGLVCTHHIKQKFFRSIKFVFLTCLTNAMHIGVAQSIR